MNVVPMSFLFFQAPSAADWLYAIASLLLGLGVAGLGLAAFMFVQAYKNRSAHSDSESQANKALGDQLAGQMETSLEQLQSQLREQHEAQLEALKQLQVAPAKLVETAPAKPAAVVVAAPTAPAEPATAPTIQATTENSDQGSDMQAAIALLEDREAQYPNRLLAAKEAFEQQLTGADGAQAHILLAETFFWLGDYATGKADREKWFSQGVKIGETAVQKNPNDVAAHLWYAANMGSHGVERGIMASLFYINPIIEHGTKAIDLDETYFHAAPLRLMGRFYHQCPGWPISKGDINKGMSLLEKAVNIAPDFLQNKVYLAEIYMAKRKKREARKLLDEILAAEPAFLPVLNKGIQKEAKSLIAKV